jgi:hypothetical protein
MISVSEHLNRLSDWSSDVATHLFDAKKYVSIVVSEPTFNQDTYDEYHGNGYAVYSGLVINSSPFTGITGQKILVDSLEWEFAYSDLTTIDSQGLVAFIDRSNTIKIWKDNTLSTSSTDPGRHMMYMRIIQLVVNKIQHGFEPYLGSKFPSPSIIESIVTNSINTTKGIQEAHYDITCYRRIGTIGISLVIEFIGFIDTINVEVQLKI